MSEFSETDQYWENKALEVEAALLKRVPENQIRPRLEPTLRATQLLGDPQKAYRVIHITGTNGKTSTARFTERLLREHGLRTGRFTSPHLVKLNERMSLDGEPVSDERLYSVWTEIEPILGLVDEELAASGDEPLTFFEALAVLGFSIFADAPVDVLVLEVGMGGEWDSTNVADGDVAVFTPISIDHADRLGDTLAAIAKTKAGIIKPGAIVLSSTQSAEAFEQLEVRAAEVAEKMTAYGVGFEVLSSEPNILGQTVSIRTLAGEYHDLNLAVHGFYQAQNAALAVAAVEAFLGGGDQRIMDDVVRAAFADFSSPGRLQVVGREPLTILDAAHNPEGAKSLAKALKDDFGSPYAIGVVSILAEKDARALLEELDDSFVEFVITQSASPRAIPAEELAVLAREIFGEDRVRVQSNPQWAMAEAILLLPAGQAGAIVATGSITLVGEVLKLKQIEAEQDA
ncbi:folylpolyglutamate synthase/dihydrofolate synthase family protein [Rhodoluna sp. KAS3]|uniref:bifunctional folylpolyglutamate synthase/dihydrofolate synthase n=1 Tax=Rhodoluna sp. KAS3 TaxID=942880 RepID=UPI0022304F6A|nr:folylpolyglutamate synthase/dihydrofolate synthase family protein [Rhodoluna sp. KAS3]BDS49192.1 dihydrofolate synthase [Rhodoluna sp. KAS3]